MASRKPVRILTMDGGGTRGIIPLAMLRHLERMSGRRIVDMFDLFAGSSAGGVLSLLLTRANGAGEALYSLEECTDLFVRDIDQIFSRRRKHRMASLWGLSSHKFELTTVKATLLRYFGESELKDVVKDVLLTTYDMEQHRPLFLTRHDARTESNRNFLLREAARATFAAPSWFPSVRLKSTGGERTFHVVDGGVYANNPATCAYAEASRLHGPGTPCVVVSLGTGIGPTAPYSVSGHGLLTWVPRLLDLMFDGQQTATDTVLRSLLRDADGGARYFRFQPPIPAERTRVDNVDPENVRALARLADDYMGTKKADLERVCELLA